MRFIRFSQLKEKGITFTRQHVGRLQKAGKFPRSVPLGENTKPFIEEEIDEYLASRVAERDARSSNSGRKCLLPLSRPLLALAAREGGASCLPL